MRRRPRGPSSRADVYLIKGPFVVLYATAQHFRDGLPVVGDLIQLRDDRTFEVVSRQWVEHATGRFRLEVTVEPWPCYAGP